MKEDLAIAKNSLLSLYNENRELRKELGQEERIDNLPLGFKAEIPVVDVNNVSKVVTGDLLELQQRLEEERKLRQESDKELELQVTNIHMMNIDKFLVNNLIKNLLFIIICSDYMNMELFNFCWFDRNFLFNLKNILQLVHIVWCFFCFN